MKFIFVLSLILLISLASANGVNINGTTELNINKTYQQDYYFNLTISNQESFNFYNIQFNKYLIATPFNLSSGESKSIQFKITSNTNINESINLYGYYDANLPANNENHNVTINTDSLSVCDLNLVIGDSVTWLNNVSGTVKLKNQETGNEITTITAGSEYKETFTSVVNFNYYVTRLGMAISQICNINIMGTTGQVHNTEYDNQFNLRVNIVYSETDMELTFLENSYTLDYNKDYQGVFNLRNSGSNTAKDVTITGDWFSFDSNNFDLESGRSRNVGYTLNPNIWETNQTNKSYTKTIRISGSNFDTIERNVTIFINYQTLSTGNFSQINEEAVAYLINAYCNENPDFEWCKKTYVYPENYTDIVSMNFTAEFMLEMYNYLIENGEAIVKLKENEANQTEKLSTIEIKTNAMSSEIVDLTKSSDGVSNLFIFFVIFLFFMAFILIGVLIFMKLSVKNKIFNSSRYQKGEKEI